eukprot:m.236404 g.236404  ORF g.236404 m.236404 type:complete len:154 (-) comp46182_c0_seq1:305-766(-)
MGGLRYVNGFPDGPSVRPNLSLGDTFAGTQAALGTVMALLARDRPPMQHQHDDDSGDGTSPTPPNSTVIGTGIGGQVVDASIVESVFAQMEGVLPEYSGAGVVRQPSGTSVSGIVPTGTYTCSDGAAVVIGANSDALFKRLAGVIDRPDFFQS